MLEYCNRIDFCYGSSRCSGVEKKCQSFPSGNEGYMASYLGPCSLHFEKSYKWELPYWKGERIASSGMGPAGWIHSNKQQHKKTNSFKDNEKVWEILPVHLMKKAIY